MTAAGGIGSHTTRRFVAVGFTSAKIRDGTPRAKGKYAQHLKFKYIFLNDEIENQLFL